MGPGDADQPALGPQEVRDVLAHYALGEIRAVRQLMAGSRDAPKALIESDRGRFVLKRRAPGRDHPLVVAGCHELQLHLTRAGLPVARLIGTRDENNSMLQFGLHVYELTTYIEAAAFRSDAELLAVRAEAAGRTLATVHRAWQGVSPQFHEPASHDPVRPTVEAAFGGSDVAVHRALTEAVARADEQLAKLGLDDAKDGVGESILHADVHPGNFVFAGSEVVGVFDFDGVLRGPSYRDLAQGAAQFSLTRRAGDVSGWPAEASVEIARAFVAGYQGADRIGVFQGIPLGAVPLLMAESLVFEASRTRLSEDLLETIGRKALWLVEHAAEVATELAADRGASR